MKLTLFLSILLYYLFLCISIVNSQEVKKFNPNYTPTNQVNWIGHWYSEDKRELIVNEQATQFEFLNQHIHVNLKYQHEVMGKVSKPVAAEHILKMIETGNFEYDIVWLDDYIYGYIAERLNDTNWGRKYLVNFENVPGYVESQKPFIIQTDFYRKQTGNMLIGPYIEGQYYGLWFNSKLADKIGLNIKEHGMTFDNLLQYAQQVQSYNKKHGTNIATFYESKDWLLQNFVFQHLVKSAVNDFEALEESKLTDQKLAALKKTYNAYQELGQYNPLIQSHNENIWFQTRHLILDDACLFYPMGGAMYSHWSGIDKEKFKKMRPAELPVFQPVDFYIGTYKTTWAVFKNAPNKDNAIQLLMHWCTPQVAEKWVRYTKTPSGIKGNFTSSEIGQDVHEKFQSYISSTYSPRIRFSANVAYLLGNENKLLNPVIEGHIRQLLTGEITAKKAYLEITKRLK